jgi:hypothetical protein
MPLREDSLHDDSDSFLEDERPPSLATRLLTEGVVSEGLRMEMNKWLAVCGARAGFLR